VSTARVGRTNGVVGRASGVVSPFTRAFIAVTGAFTAATHAFIAVTGAFIAATHAFTAMTRAFIALTHAFIALTRAFIALTRAFIAMTHAFVTLTRAPASPSLAVRTLGRTPLALSRRFDGPVSSDRHRRARGAGVVRVTLAHLLSRHEVERGPSAEHRAPRPSLDPQRTAAANLRTEKRARTPGPAIGGDAGQGVTQTSTVTAAQAAPAQHPLTRRHS
jgi:hypothetical protein